MPIQPAVRPSVPGTGAPRPALPRPIARVVPHLLAMIVALLAVSVVQDARTGATIVGITSAVFAIAITLNHGGSYLPPSTVYFLSSGVFIGCAVYYLLIVDSVVPVLLIRDAATLALLSTIGISFVVSLLNDRWGTRWPTGAARPTGRTRPRPPGALPVTGLVLMGISQAPPVEAFVGPTSYSIGLAGVMLVVVWASTRWGQLRWFGDIFVAGMVFVLPWTWVQLTFTGGGRLMIAGVSIAAFLVWNVFNPSRFQKLMLILAIPAFLVFAGLSRSNDDDSSGSSVIASGDGLGSVYVPLETFARTIGPLEREQRQMLGPRMGETFLNTFYLPIPRAMWPDKPIGFGSELTEVLEPRLVKANHSMAALAQGEWYANFGYAGLVLMVPVFGWFLAWLDKRHARMVAADYADDRNWWRLALLACIASSLGDLCWVGSFMIYARGGLAAIVVWASAHVALGRRRPGATPGHHYLSKKIHTRPDDFEPLEAGAR